MSVSQVIVLARKHVRTGPMQSSAELCLTDAIRLYENGKLPEARKRALKSLAYSVGILHTDYQRAK